MNPIIKVSRIAPSAFSLSLRSMNLAVPITQAPDTKSVAKPFLSLPEVPNKTDAFASASKLRPRVPYSAPTPIHSELNVHESTHERLEDVFESARSNGWKKGESEGRASVEQEYAQKLKQLGELIRAMETTRDALLQKAEDEVISLVFDSVAKIVGTAATDKQIAVNVVREAMAQVKGREKLTLRVCSRDHQVVKAALDQSNGSDLHAKNICVVEDDLVKWGGCVIETEAGNLDARLEIQMQCLKDTLITVRKSPTHD
jgi:flagellar assembly protein FliH